jgi:mannose/fructose/N-acetylgalactosamine-specific phosphotransferase system component IIB
MPIVLFRVDERLIHGQVVVGWGGPLQFDRMIVVDDDLAESSWEQELYALGVPDEMEASFVGVEEARRSLEGWRSDPARVSILVRNISTLRRLAEDGALRGQTVNLGGIHHGAGRRRVLPYLFLGPEEEQELKRIEASGATIAAQDLPGSRSVALDQLLGA